MMEDNVFQFIGIGSPLMDSLLFVDEEFLSSKVPGEKGGMELVEKEQIDKLASDEAHANTIQHAPGGSAANTIIGLAKLGLKTTFLGKLGEDKESTLYKKYFSNTGTAVDRFKHHPTQSTGCCLSMITPDSERTCRTFLGAAMTLESEEISADDFQNCIHAHVEGYVLVNPDLSYKIFTSAQEAGCTISLDLASFEIVRDHREMLEDVLEKFVDIVFSNEDEAREYAQSTDPVVGLHTLSELCSVASVKLGADGAYIRRGQEQVKVNSYPVNAVDTTGAGDLWASGFLFGYSQGYSLEKCGIMGSLLGSSVVKEVGTVIPDETWKTIKTQLSRL